MGGSTKIIIKINPRKEDVKINEEINFMAEPYRQREAELVHMDAAMVLSYLILAT